MLTNNLGYPRVGANRELKKACEHYWAGKITREQLFFTAKNLREEHWKLQQKAGIDLIPCNDFSFYDHVLDMSLLLGAIPARYESVLSKVKKIRPSICISQWPGVTRKTALILQPWK
jgi:5-methyltetrahydropteroyltriglutamate--homocysteine methyltransferase